MKTIRIIVSGRVQGVFYRDSTERKALDLGLKGYVRNLSSGDVEIVVQGDEASKHALISWCREGPSHASVTEIAHEEFEASEYDDFEVKY